MRALLASALSSLAQPHPRPNACSPSGINDFPNVSPEDVVAALPTIKALGVPLLVHSELVDEDVPSGVRKRRTHGLGPCTSHIVPATMAWTIIHLWQAALPSHVSCRTLVTSPLLPVTGRPRQARDVAGLAPAAL